MTTEANGTGLKVGARNKINKPKPKKSLFDLLYEKNKKRITKIRKKIEAFRMNPETITG